MFIRGEHLVGGRLRQDEEDETSTIMLAKLRPTPGRVDAVGF